MTASAQPPQLTQDRIAGLLSHTHAKASAKQPQKLLPHNAPAGLLGHDAETASEAPRADAPQMSGFRTKPRGPQKVQDDNVAADEKPGTDLVPYTPPQRESEPAFDNAAFLKLLATIYGVQEIEAVHAAKLKDFTLDESRGVQTGADGKLFAKVGDATVEITKESVLTDSPLTPALAYQMAAAAAANPQGGKLILEGDDNEEKIMLFFAAQHLGLEIEEGSIPEMPSNIAALAEKFHAFEQEMGLENIAGTYIPAEEKAPVPEPAATRPAQSNTTQPHTAQPYSAPMGALSPA